MLVSNSLWLAVCDSDYGSLVGFLCGDLVGVLDLPSGSVGEGDPRIAPVMAIDEMEPSILDTCKDATLSPRSSLKRLDAIGAKWFK